MVESLVLGILNIFTDIMLIILPLPTLLKLKRSGYAKFRILFLFTLGIFLVAITVIRLPFNFKDLTFQEHLTTLTSVEIFVAAFIANTPTLYALRKPHPCSSEQTNCPLREIHHDEYPKSDKRNFDGSSTSGDTSMKRQKKPTKNVLTKKAKPIQELSGVVPEAQIGDEKRQHTMHGRSNTMEWVLGEQINKDIARKAEIINGKVECVGEDVKRYTFDEMGT
ncbi:hypothetical protein HYALB_00006820 [Hymenoscyphus albidus]|uniref:Rhodopsin domain-containing protein n=1 Tax=Hymenoscyphus albidus TaxID=595503 RepID=A0A9N9PUJ5_9HELO|nr:hypothetical protein HYALB_00006820 [Hymenoscyphus albidus]